MIRLYPQCQVNQEKELAFAVVVLELLLMENFHFHGSLKIWPINLCVKLDVSIAVEICVDQIFSST